MDLIVETRFGSHLYGTATSRSDIDIKAVYVPPARDILLQRIQATIARGPSEDPGEKNVAGDEAVSVQDQSSRTLQSQAGVAK